MTDAPLDRASALADAYRHAAAIARSHARDEWLAALYAPAAGRDALFALTAFDHEIRGALLRARDPRLAEIRLAWWREAVLGNREGEAAGSPTALAMRGAIAAFSLPARPVEAMLDARLEEIAPERRLTLAEFEDRYAAGSEGARLELATRIAVGGPDLDTAEARGPAGAAIALARLLADLSTREGASAKLFPADVAERHGASLADLVGARATPGVVGAAAEIRALARTRLAEAETRLLSSPAPIRPAFASLATLRLVLDGLEHAAARPFDPPQAASAFRRQWAIWRWARRFRLRVTD